MKRGRHSTRSREKMPKADEEAFLALNHRALTLPSPASGRGFVVVALTRSLVT